MVLFRKKIWPRRELSAFGYREVDRAGFSWLANEEGAWFLMGVEDWSPQALSGKEGWHFWKRQYHSLYLAEDQSKRRYLIKVYPPKKNRAGFFVRKANRARKEFWNTLKAYRNDIETVLPVAVGEGKEDKERGIIIYPFLDNAINLARLYADEHLERLAPRERQCLEKKVGELLRKLIDRGMYPRDLVLDHFLADRKDGKLSVYWIDLERVQPIMFRKRKKGIECLGKLLALLEWFRVSGAKVNRPSMMRIACAYFHREGLERPDKRLSRAVLRAAENFWCRRRLDRRRPHPVTVAEPDA